MAGFGSLVPDVMPFGAGTPQEVGEMPPNILDKILQHLISSTATLPQRTIDAAAGSTPGLRREDYTDNPNASQPNAPLYNAAGETALTMMGGSSAVPAEANSLRAGIKAYHGSPHDFDRFDLSKIGTGEGAQAYGHGLYFAEDERVAKSYRDALTAQPRLRFPQHPELAASQQAYNDAHSAANSAIFGTEENLKAAIAARNTANEKLQQIKYEPLPAHLSGKMYEVNINAAPEHFLDWDASLANQPEEIRKLLGLRMADSTNFGGPLMKSDVVRGYFPPEKKGVDLYKTAGMGGGPYTLDIKERAAKRLAEVGIPGIRYLDQGSRIAGEGSRNYVMFNDKLIDILRKYGVAGLPAAEAAGVAFGGPPQSEGM